MRRLCFTWRRQLLNEFLKTLTLLEQVFLGLAAFGGTIFAVSTVLQLLGGGDGDMLDGHVDAEGALDSAHGSEPGFKVFSLQSLGAFTLVSGSTGLAISREFNFGGPIAIATAIASGLVILWCMSLIFKTFVNFSSNGALDYAQALLENGQVYLTVPEEGTGLVQLTIQGRMVTASARSLSGRRIDTGKDVIVREVEHDDTLVVEILDDDVEALPNGTELSGEMLAKMSTGSATESLDVAHTKDLERIEL